jgi:hypothetical protein
MLAYAANFWPLFWTVIGGSMVLTVLLSLLVATFSPTWFRTPQRRQPAQVVAVRTAAHDRRAEAA